jgi:hypothetical protein
MRNKNGLMRERTCKECGLKTREYKLVHRREHEWVQAERAYLPISRTDFVCRACIPKIEHLDTVVLMRSPELEVA